MTETGLAKNNFAVQKNILYNQILTGLIQFDTSTTLSIQMQQDIFACQKLLQKGLIDQAKLKLKQLKPDAEKYELHEVSLQALQIETAIAAREQYRLTGEKDFDQWISEINTCTQKITAEAQAKYTNNKAQKIQVTAGGKGASYAKAVKQLLDQNKAQQGTRKVTQKTRMDQLQTEALYHFMSGDAEQAFDANSNFISLMESEKHWVQFFPQRYFSALNNYLIDCFVLKKETELRNSLEKMRALKDNPAFKKTTNLESNIFRITYQVEMNYLIAGGEFAVAHKKISAIKDGLLKFKDKISILHRMNMQYLCAYVLFGVGRYKECSAEIDILQQYPRNEKAAFIDDVASIMQVICHFEMGSYSIIDSLVKSSKRKLSEGKEAVMLMPEFDLLNTLLTFSSKKITHRDWQKLWQKLSYDSDGNTPYTPLSEYFDFFTYVFAKSEKIDFESAWNKLHW